MQFGLRCRLAALAWTRNTNFEKRNGRAVAAATIILEALCWIKPNFTSMDLGCHHMMGISFPVLNPATEDAFATITLGGAKDTEAAIAAAKAAFPAWSMTSPADRAGYLQKLLDVYIARNDEMGATISTEMGAPIDMAVSDQAGSGISHLKAFIRALGTMEFQRPLRARCRRPRYCL